MMLLWPQPTEQGLRAVYDDKYFRNEKFLSGGLMDYPLPDEELRLSLAAIKNLPKPEARKSGRW